MAVQRPTPPRGDSKQSRILRTKAFPRPEQASGAVAPGPGPGPGGKSGTGGTPGFGGVTPLSGARSATGANMSRSRAIIPPVLNRLTIVWVQRSGVPFNTTGFFATVSRGNVPVDTAFFDSFGVARFNNVPTPTGTPLTLRIFDRNGVVFRTRFIPAGVEAFAVIG